MIRGLKTAVAFSLAMTAVVLAQDTIPADLRAVADAERAFARSATVKGIRDSFLEFFSDDAIALRPEATSAKARLRAQTPQPFSALELTWEPRTGDVAASGELAWLTGPSTFVDRTRAGAAPAYGNYLSVWRKQPDGRWRVYIDIGSTTPQLVTFAPGFVRFPLDTRYRGDDDKHRGTTSLFEADRALNGHLSGGPPAAYGAALTPASRFHRPGFVSLVGAGPIKDWLASNAATLSATTTAAESSRSGDLGYTYGTFVLKGEPPSSGAYLRIWVRDGAGNWWIAADVTQPSGN